MDVVGGVQVADVDMAIPPVDMRSGAMSSPVNGELRLRGPPGIWVRQSNTTGQEPVPARIPRRCHRDPTPGTGEEWSDTGAGFRFMTQAIFDGIVVADSDDVRTVEGMAYFPIDDVAMEQLVQSTTTSRCFWKGKATYWHVRGADAIAPDAAFEYAHPWPLARRLVRGRIAFWQGVDIVGD